ncbi:methyltransferase RsmF C-terminal domain-like protein [Pollutibacter soli]|uniref:methyltransferase RsmF C-terminal domain-like protein n=1 Tax=Pollutibacter soli TaxID=3034157 RepID=UPI0030136947
MNLPAELISSLTGLPGFDPVSFEAVHNNHTQVNSIRLNPSKCPTLSVPASCLYQIEQSYWKLSARPIPWNSNGWYLSERPLYTLDPLLHSGGYYVQEASSMFISYAIQQLLKGRDSLKALDLCAAPGGKTTLLASEACFSLVVANEVISSRVNILYENVVKWGESHVLVSRNDPSAFGDLHQYFDVMLVDAPCSGSGLFRRDPDAMEEWSVQQVGYCSTRQRRILEDALPSLKSGGLLIYSTCSYSKEENEDIVDWLCETHAFITESFSVPSEWGVVETLSPKAGAKGFRFYPDKVAGEGLFICCLRKPETKSVMGWRSQKIPAAPINIKEIVKTKITDDSFVFVNKDELAFAVPAGLEEELGIIVSHLQLRKSGVLLGSVIRNELIPDHELALSNLLNQGIASVELDREQSIRFLRKENLDSSGFPKGWVLARFGSRPLGWMKVLPNRANNYYPAAWRITTSKQIDNE